MSSKDLLLNITRYVKSRYDLDINSSDREMVMKKAEYLARARRDIRLYEYIAKYRSICGGVIVPILKKTVSVAKLSRLQAATH